MFTKKFSHIEVCSLSLSKGTPFDKLISLTSSVDRLSYCLDSVWRISASAFLIASPARSYVTVLTVPVNGNGGL